MPGTPIEVVETAPARAALAGNPSDGYGGAVLAVPVSAVRARVVARPAPQIGVGGRWFSSLDDVRAAVREQRVDGLAALAAAALDAFAVHVARPAPCDLDVSTTIPRSVGLAGSSAVVVGVLRALARVSGRAIPPPDELAAIALSAEVDGLGIAAGLQDRVVQCRDAPTHMEFGGGGHELVEPAATTHLLVAYRPGASAPSGATHGPLKERFDRGDPDVRRAMTSLADQAREATAALRRGDPGALGAAMDNSFDIRRAVVPLDAAHVEMIECARASGASANFSGSGGSITVLVADHSAGAAVRSALADIGCRFLDVRVG